MNHEHYMHLALDLAVKGWPEAAPNPLVGCVIVRGNEVLASGYHQGYGRAHAEVNAVAALPANVPAGDCVLYVTLEPCSHHGKTPPCADLLVNKGFKKVIVACLDPNPEVAGKGIARLRASGIEVIVGVCEKEARFLNRRFMCFHENKRPYVILKWAQTADGFISRKPVPHHRDENRISGMEAQSFVHGLRSEVQGIMVGKNTVLIDNPQLTTRLVRGNNPTRIFIDQNLEVPPQFNIYNAEARTIIFNGIKNGEEGHLLFIKLDFSTGLLTNILHHLHTLNLQTLLVEGGSILLQHFITEKLWDEALVIENPALFFERGLKAPILPLETGSEWLGNDKLRRVFREPKNVELDNIQKSPRK